MSPNEEKTDEQIEIEEAMSLDGYFSEEPLDLKPNYPPLDESFDSAVLITNLPRVPQAKIEKLAKVVSRLYSKIGTLSVSDNFNGVFMPFDETSAKSCGFAIVLYTTAEEAKKAVEVTNEHPLDKNHTLSVSLYSDTMKLNDVPEEYEEMEPTPYVERPDTTSFLTDENQRDSFVIRQGIETVVNWSDGKHDPVVDYDGSREKNAGINWCDYYCQWSPKGSFLATLLPNKGVILWGGSGYEKMGRFPAQGVQFVVFSPQENYLLTSNENRNDPNAIKIFNVRTSKLLRTFPLFPNDYLSADQQKALKNGNMEAVPPPPAFQWSNDDKYIARMGKDLISIYETPKMKLLDSRSLSTNGIHEFQWSPRDNTLAYWAPEVGNAPAHVDLVQIPSRKFLRQKNLFNVTKCSMTWQSEGDYLGVKVTRHTKSKKTLYNNIELFRLRDAGIPVEMLDIKDAVMAFAWQPGGSKFSMIHAENPSSTKVSVSFYDMNKMAEIKTKVSPHSKKTKVELREVAELNKVETLEGKQCNCIFWSPAGNVIIMAGLGDSASGKIEFYDVDNRVIMAEKEHYRANEVLWDPSGRTVATAVVQPIGGGHFKFAMDNGYMLWTFQGKQICQKSYETFYQFQWRPRPQLLEKEQKDLVVKNIKKFEKQFDKADKERARERYLQETKGKRLLRSKYRERMARLKAFRNDQKAARMDLLGGYDSEDEDNFIVKEMTVETILTTKEETVYL